jgi:tetratricopeptide (TPR) repeat protein
MGARGASSQSAKVRIPGPPIKAWLALAAVLAAALLVLAALAGTRPTGSQPVDVLPVVGDPIEETLRRPAVAAFLAAMVLVLLVAAVRGARLRWLAHSPGPVDVADLKAAGSLPDGLAERLTLRFRKRLADLHLATPGPQPGVAPATDFVDLIGSATRDSKNLFATVAGLLRVAWPSQAYQVQATLVQHAERGCGVSVQVVMMPATTTPPTTCWATSWEAAIDRAANRAAAFILPRTRVSRRPPWTAWHGYVLPPRLLEAYELGAVCTHGRRYDEALREYYTALELDPKNLEVRLRLGFIQEKLGLALDALTTYQAIADMTCDCPTPGARRSIARAVVSARRRSQAIAAYRRAVLLGSAEGVSKQWCASDEAGDGTRRDEQRRACRERLRPMLMRVCKHRWEQTEARRRDVTLGELLAEDAEIRDRDHLLREVLQRAALQALAELWRDLPPELTGGDQSSLTRTAVALSERCVHLRLRSTRRALDADAGDESLTLQTLEGWVRNAGLGRNAPWSERYSAASLYALAISGDVRADPHELSEAAVAHLERAIEGAESGYVASRRAWLVSEDPDFDALRSTPRFQRFEAIYFPSRNPAIMRPRGAHRWEVVEYVHELLGRCADCREDVWCAQFAATIGNGEPDRLESAWREELIAWELVSEVASNCEHWQTRLKLVEALETWTAQTGGAAPLGYPDYAAVAPDANPLGEAIDDARDRLAAVRALAARQRAGLDGLARTASARGGPIRASEQRARRSPSARLCRERTAAWQQLGDMLKLSSPEHVVPSAAGPDDAGAALNGRHRRLPWRARAGGQTTSQAAR